MACGCGSNTGKSEYKDGICEVCRLIDKDTAVKQVQYCSFCGVNICCECEARYDKRFFAAIKLKFNL